MRLDLFLKVSRIVPRRPLAKDFCDQGRVRVNGQAARASHEVRAGDLIDVEGWDGTRRWRVESVPEGRNVTRGTARELAVLLESTRKDILE